MTDRSTMREEAIAAAQHLVARFAAFDTEGYFGCFGPLSDGSA